MTLRIEIDKIADSLTFRSFFNDELVETHETTEQLLAVQLNPVVAVLQGFIEKTCESTGVPIPKVVAELFRAASTREKLQGVSVSDEKSIQVPSPGGGVIRVERSEDNVVVSGTSGVVLGWPAPVAYQVGQALMRLAVIEVAQMVDVSREEMAQGRPSKRPVYGWPVCGSCHNALDRPALSVVPTGPMDGPAAARRKQGHVYEECFICGIKTIVGLYLKWPTPPKCPNLFSYLELRHRLLLARKTKIEVEEDKVLEIMDNVWRKMSSKERDLSNALPPIAE